KIMATSKNRWFSLKMDKEDFRDGLELELMWVTRITLFYEKNVLEVKTNTNRLLEQLYELCYAREKNPNHSFFFLGVRGRQVVRFLG
ncbi:12029_t:CDS:2, partial [Ambispora gerdemannii]